MTRPTSAAGFTLIELSIVLVIIGLVVGGVLGGRELMRTAALHKLVGQVDSYRAAVNTFKLKYNCLPGDCPNAEAFFGTDPNGCPVGPSASKPSGTCNGNGNGMVEHTPAAGSESYRLWEMLSQAKLIDGSYMTRGYAASGAAGATFPAVPSQFRRHRQGGVEIYWNSYALYSPITEGHVLVVGGKDQTAANSHPTLTDVEARWVDAKVDDGKPTTGSVRAGSVYGVCFSGNEYRSNDTYAFTYPGPNYNGCSLFFKAGF